MRTNNSFSAIPRLPPHRLELKSGPVSNPGAVPFLWEQTPGQPKEEREPETQNLDRPPIVPKLPPGRNPKASRHDSQKHVPSSCDDISHDFKNGTFIDEKVRNFEGAKEKSDVSSESGDNCDAFTDAHDTLSRTESFFLNCSVSGLSELDDLDMKLKSSGSFLMNSKTQELMMDRFLPAAKAMASEAPKYAHKKQHVVQERQQLKKILVQDQPSLRYGPSYANRYSHYHDNEEESDEEYDEHENFSVLCGFLPRFCLKSSLCRLNPVPAMNMRSCLSISPSNKLQPRSSSSGSFSETENESKSDTSEPRSVSKIQTAEFKETKSRLRNEQSHLHSHKTLTYFDAPMSFPEEKEVFSVPQETKKPGIKGTGLHKNGCKTFGDFLAEHESSNEVDSECPVVEKTLYVDTIHKMESPDTVFSPRTQVTKMIVDHTRLAHSSPEDSSKLDFMDAKDTLLPVSDKFTSSIGNSNEKSEMEVPKTFENERGFELYSTAAEDMQVSEKEAAEVSPKTITVIESHLSHYEFLAPPPLPNSPSDSWLSCTLPTASRKSLSRRSSLGEHTNTQYHCYGVPNGK